MMEAVFGFIGVIVGFAMPLVTEFVNEWRLRRKSAAYLSVRVISVLDEYVSKCCDVAYDDGSIDGRPSRDDGIYEPQVSDTPPLKFPDDIDWKSIDLELMVRILTLPTKAEEINRVAQENMEYSTPPDHSEFFNPRRKGYAALGLEAIELIEILREKYNVKSNVDFSPDWDRKESLQRIIDEIEARSNK